MVNIWHLMIYECGSYLDMCLSCAASSDEANMLEDFFFCPWSLKLFDLIELIPETCCTLQWFLGYSNVHESVLCCHCYILFNLMITCQLHPLWDIEGTRKLALQFNMPVLFFLFPLSMAWCVATGEWKLQLQKEKPNILNFPKL